MPQGPTGLEPGAWGAKWVNKNDVSDLHNRDEATVRARLRQDALGAGKPLHPWIDAFDNFNVTINSLINGLSDLITRLFNNAGKFIAEVGTAIVDTVGNTIQSMLNFLNHVFRRGKINSENRADGVATGKTLDDVVDAAAAVTEKTYMAAGNAETAIGFFNEPRQLPSWVGAQSDDVSYPHYLVNQASTTLGTSTALSSLTTQDRIVLIPVVVGQTRQYDVVKVGISAITATSLRIGLYDVDETTGYCRKVVDLGDVRSQYSSSTVIQSFSIPDAIPVQKGEIYYIAVLASGGTVSLSYSSTISGTRLVNYGRWPKFLSSYVSLGTGLYSVLPSDFSDAALSSDGTFRAFWGGLGVYAPTVVPSRLKLYDSFDRPNTSTGRTALGDSWYRRTGNGLRIYSNQAVADSSTGTSISTFTQRLNYLDQRCEATFSRGYRYSDAAMILTLRGNGSGQFMYLRVTQKLLNSVSTNNFTARIYTASSFSSVGSDFTGGTAVGNSWSFSGAYNGGIVTDVWAFQAVGDLYVGFRNGSEVCRWQDSGYNFQYTDSHKEVGIGGTYEPAGGVQQVAGMSVIDNWSAIDL